MPIHPSNSRLSPRVSPLAGERASSRGPGAAAVAVDLPAAGYAIVFMDGGQERRGRSGLSHADAMADAEVLQREGKSARVMHVLGARSYEVDRYPPR